jgi:hypothetical protein
MLTPHIEIKCVSKYDTFYFNVHVNIFCIKMRLNARNVSLEVESCIGIFSGFFGIEYFENTNLSLGLGFYLRCAMNRE